MAVVATEYAVHRAPTDRKKPVTRASWFLSRTLILVAGERPVQVSRWSRPLAIGANLPDLVRTHLIGWAQCLHVAEVSFSVRVLFCNEVLSSLFVISLSVDCIRERGASLRDGTSLQETDAEGRRLAALAGRIR